MYYRILHFGFNIIRDGKLIISESIMTSIYEVRDECSSSVR